MADLFKGNNGAKFIEKQAKTLSGFYVQAYKDLQNMMRSEAANLYQKNRAQIMMMRVDEAIEKMDTFTKKQIQKDIQTTYLAFGEQAREQMRKVKDNIPKEFSTVHIEAMQAATDDAYLRFGSTLQGVKKSAQDFVRIAQQERIREMVIAGQITGQASEEIAKTVLQNIKDQGIVSLIDKGGKKWQLDTYANMLTRQMLANSSRDSVTNNALEFGFDLVKVSSHNSDHYECRVWENKILSLTGISKKYPSIEDARAAGLFHIGCKHGYSMVLDL